MSVKMHKACMDCKHNWYPPKHLLSAPCPKCGSTNLSSHLETRGGAGKSSFVGGRMSAPTFGAFAVCVLIAGAVLFVILPKKKIWREIQKQTGMNEYGDEVAPDDDEDAALPKPKRGDRRAPGTTGERPAPDAPATSPGNDKLTLKDGRVLIGKVAAESQGVISFRYLDGKRLKTGTFLRGDIRSVEKAPAADPPGPKKP